MNNRIYLVFEYLYLAMAAFSLYISYKAWPEDQGRTYLFVFFAVVAVFMFFFKRKFRKKIQSQSKQD